MKKEYTWNSHMSIDEFFEKLESNTYSQNILQITLHWDENCIFLKRKSNKSFYLNFHSRYRKNALDQYLKGKVYATSDGIKIKAKLKRNLFVKIFFTFWYACVSSVFLLMLFTNPFASLVILLFLALSIMILYISKNNPSDLLKFMDEICTE